MGSIVKPENFNYAGMGACDSCNSGRQFPSAQMGVRAQIQHLRNFSDPTSRASRLANAPVVEWYGRRSTGALDPVLAIHNYDTFFAKGNAPTWNVMGGPGKWASTPTYGTIILSTYNRMLTFNGLQGSCPPDRLALGASPRAGIALLRVAKARALSEGRDFVLPDDVKAVARPVLSHRLILAPEARSAGLTAEEIVGEAVEQTPVPV